jgi:hypothetical protein
VSDYPRLPTLRESEAEVLSGHEPVRATNGALHMRRMFSGEKRNFSLAHVLTPAQRADLEAHYAAHKDASFSFTWAEDGQAYTVSYGAAPQFGKAGVSFSRARVQLMER